MMFLQSQETKEFYYDNGLLINRIITTTSTFLMTHQPSSLCEGCKAKFTFVWLFSSVQSFVVFEGFLCFERLSTVTADFRALPSMFPKMLHKPSLLFAINFPVTKPTA